eukprot:4748084-Ditylum_brightwellii.AAC.2
MDRHNNMVQYVHWCLLKDRKHPMLARWEDHKPPKTMVLSDNTMITWGKPTLMDKHVEANRPDIVLIEEGQSHTRLIDISIPLDANIVSMNADKHTKYRNLEIAFKKNHKLRRVHMIPVMVGAFGTVYRNLDTYVTKISLSIRVGTIQKIALLGSAHIIWQVLTDPLA